jgi:ABC-type uncharacterized transport system involved in gliding motility auxiliary subunit
MKTDSTSSRSARRSASFEGAVSLVIFAGILIILNYLGFKHYKHVDLSQSQYYTLSNKTRDVLKKLDSPVTITTLLNINDPIHADQIDRLLKEYQEIGGKNIVVDKIDLAYDPARASALQKRLHFEATDFLVIFEYKDRIRFVKQQDVFEINPMTGAPGAFKGEQQFTSALVAIIEGKASRVYFTQGHGEHSLHDPSSPQGYGSIGLTLKSENIDPADLNLAAKGEVPADADAVVIAGPSISFSPLEAQALDKYLENNGKLLILLDPYVILGLDDLLKKYGMKYENDLVLYRGMTTTGTQMTVPIALISQGGFGPHPVTEKFAAASLQLQISDARSITLLPVDKGQPNPKVQFLLQTDPDAWGWINTNPSLPDNPRSLTYNKVTDIPGPVVIAAAYDGGTVADPNSKATVPGTRIIAVGSSKFLENDVEEAVGANIFTNSLDWLVKKDAILDISPKKPQEYGLALSPIQYRTVVWTALFFIPGAALVLGILTWFSRRK